MILTECAECGTQFKLPDKLADKKVRCARCHAKFRATPVKRLDEKTAVTEPAEAPGKSTSEPPAKPSTDETKPAPPPDTGKDEDDDILPLVSGDKDDKPSDTAPTAAEPSAEAKPDSGIRHSMPSFEARDLDEDAEAYDIKADHEVGKREPRAGVTASPAPAKRNRVCPECGAEMLVTQTVCDVCKHNPRKPRKKTAPQAKSAPAAAAGSHDEEGVDPAVIGLSVGLIAFAAVSFYLVYVGWF